MTTGNLGRIGKLLDLNSEWVDTSQVRIRVRAIGENDKVMVDLFELTPEEGTHVRREKLNAIAIQYAKRHGVSSHDFVLLRDTALDRKTMRIEGDMVTTFVRERSYMFGVN